jgi:hypothetical protein
MVVTEGNLGKAMGMRTRQWTLVVEVGHTIDVK